MKLSPRASIFAALSILILLLGFLLRSAIQAYFVNPVALLLWIFNRVFGSVDQSIYWIGLILIMLLMTMFWFTTGTMELETRYQSNRSSALENIDQWRMLILSTRDQASEKNFLKQKLASLLSEVYASKQPNLAPWQIDDAIKRGELVLPDSVRTFLMLNEQKRPTLIQRLRCTLQAPGRWARHWTGQEARDYYASIEEVIALIENKLESEDDE